MDMDFDIDYNDMLNVAYIMLTTDFEKYSMPKKSQMVF